LEIIMRAVVLCGFAGSESLAVGDVDEPSHGPTDVLLRFEAGGIGAWDVMTANGGFVAMGGQSTFPQIVGWDVCGVVTETGSSVTGLRAGDRVFGFSPQPWSQIGVFAEHVALPAGLLAVVPDSLDTGVAATLPVLMLTADIAVREAGAGIAGGSGTVLVLGAAGGVGGYVTQMAAAAGWRVVASVSADDGTTVLDLGVSVVIDRDRNVSADTIGAVGRVDAVIDLVGSAASSAAIAALRPGGRFVTTVPGPLPDLSEGCTSHVVGVQPDPVRLAALADLVAAGALVARTGERFPFADARRAHEHAATAGGRRVVLHV
jgi:NADPH:quinone reductase